MAPDFKMDVIVEERLRQVRLRSFARSVRQIEVRHARGANCFLQTEEGLGSVRNTPGTSGEVDGVNSLASSRAANQQHRRAFVLLLVQHLEKILQAFTRDCRTVCIVTGASPSPSPLQEGKENRGLVNGQMPQRTNGARRRGRNPRLAAQVRLGSKEVVPTRNDHDYVGAVASAIVPQPAHHVVHAVRVHPAIAADCLQARFFFDPVAREFRESLSIVYVGPPQVTLSPSHSTLNAAGFFQLSVLRYPLSLIEIHAPRRWLTLWSGRGA